MKLTDFSCATEEDYTYLREELDKSPKEITLTFSDCELPSGCTPSYATVEFYKRENSYVMRFQGMVRYSGKNLAVSALCDSRPLLFQTFSKMRGFLSLLSADTYPPVVKPCEATLEEEYDLNSVVNMDEITLPTSAVQTAPDCGAIQHEFEKVIVGQETAVETISHQAALHLSKSNPQKPLSIVLAGPSGTGKSEMAKALPKILSKLSANRYSTVWTDLNTFGEAHSVNRLVGAPPGYVGYDDTTIFEAVTQNPHTVYIFDEMEKAHPDVLKTFMAILDEGRCAARKELENHSREYDFKHCIFMFTTNLNLDTVPQKSTGFTFPDDVECVRHTDDAVEVEYTESGSEDELMAVTKRIYRNTEAARKAFMETGVLREIASRFNCFINFDELDAEAKVRILAKQIIETAFEYNLRLTYISSAILQSLVDASTSENVLTVRSFKVVNEGYLAAAFAEAAVRCAGQAVRLEGTIETPEIIPDP